MKQVCSTALRTATLLAAAATLPTAAADALPLQPYGAVYEVRIKGLRGEMKASLNAEAGAFTASSELRARGLASLLARGEIEEYARFDIDQLQLRPDEYRSSDTLGSDDTAIEMQFDWSSGHARGTENDAAFDHPADAKTYDRVTLQYGLMLDLLNDRLADSYVLLDGKKLKELTVTQLGEQTIEVPFGTYRAIGIAHQSANSSRTTTLWCAPELGFLPVRIEQHRDGKLNVRADLAEYTPSTPSVSAR